MTDRYLPLALNAFQVGPSTPVDVWIPAGALRIRLDPSRILTRA